MSNTTRFSVGIDISKGKSTVAVIDPFGNIVKSPFEIRHTSSDLKKLAGLIKSLDGETRIVMEYTGIYYQPVARFLSESGIFVSVVHAKILHDFANNSIRRIKTDKADAVKIANYGLLHWDSLKCYSKEDDAEILKDLKTNTDNTPEEKPEEKKAYDLSKLKEKKLLSVDEAAELIGIGRNKIRKISDDENCPFVLWIGSHRKIKREAFEKFLSEIQSA